MTKPRIYAMSFASVYPLYVEKAKKKGRTKAEVDEIIFWLTGHQAKSLKKVIDAKTDLETFFAKAPCFQPNVSLIKGVGLDDRDHGACVQHTIHRSELGLVELLEADAQLFDHIFKGIVDWFGNATSMGSDSIH